MAKNKELQKAEEKYNEIRTPYDDILKKHFRALFVLKHKAEEIEKSLSVAVEEVERSYNELEKFIGECDELLRKHRKE